jgi:hypothetical protein
LDQQHVYAECERLTPKVERVIIRD